MKRHPVIAVWVCSAFAIAVGLTACVLYARGADERGIHSALRASARFSFLLFWVAYSGGALASLFGPAFQPLKQRAREFGLAFAAAQTVHLGLVAWLCIIGAAPVFGVFVFFGVATAWIYLLALLSIPFLQRSLTPKLWRLIQIVGMNYILYAFAADFLSNPLQASPKHLVEYLPFEVLVIAGLGLRLAAFTRSVGRKRSGSARQAA